MEPIFAFYAPSNGKMVRLTLWNGQSEFANEIPSEILKWVGGKKIGIVQVGKPVGPGTGGRSSLALSAALAEMFDGIVHWARDTATYDSILAELKSGRLRQIPPPKLPPHWQPEVVIMPAG